MNLKKDLSYPAPNICRSPRLCTQVLHYMADQGGPSHYIRMSNLMLQARYGAQMWVSKDVSDDLIASDVNPEEIKFEEIEWPERRLELFFEDDSIPTFLASLSSNREHAADLTKLLEAEVNQDLLPRGAEHDIPYISIQAEDDNKSSVSLTLTTSDINKFATSAEVNLGSYEDPKKLRIGLDEDEMSQIRFLAVLLFKVLLFASSEGHTIRRTKDRPTKKQGGKPGFKNRPVTDRLIVEYLPRHQVERLEAAQEEKQRSREFNGRRGHWRRFRADKFKNMKGKKVFIYPIPGPDGTIPKRKFVVRKPQEVR